MRVLHLGKFYPPQRGGMESHVKTLCEGLQRQIDVEVLVSNTGARTERTHCEGVAVTRVACLAQVSSTSINPGMVAEIRRSTADLIHLHWPNPMTALAYLLSGHAGRLVVTYHSDVIKQRILGRVFDPVLDAVLQRAEAIIASSERYLETSAVLSRYAARCRMIPFGIAKEYFDPPEQAGVEALRKRFGDVTILSVGRLVDYKGFDTLIRALAETPGRLLIAGEGPLKPKLMALARALHLERRVVFLGDVPDPQLRTLYHAADVVVLASTNRREAFGLVQAEAMAACRPVINTALESGVPMVSLDGVTGLTVAHSDAGAMARAIRLLLEDASLRLAYGRAARLRAETLFRADLMCARTVALYQGP